MHSVLQILDPAMTAEEIYLAAWLKQRLEPLGVRVHSAGLGNRGDYADALFETLDADLLPLRLGTPLTAVGPLRQLARAHGAETLFCWGYQALTAGALARAGLGKLRLVLGAVRPPPKSRQVRWFRSLDSDINVVAASSTIAQAFTRSGVAPESVRIIRPAVDFGRLRAARELNVRQQLGLGEFKHVMISVGPLNRPHAQVNSLWAMAILQQVYPEIALIFSGKGYRNDRIQRFATDLNLFNRVRFAHGRWALPELLEAADVALFPVVQEVSTLPLTWVMGAGIPIVATVNRGNCELIEDNHSAMLARAEDPRGLAQRCHQLFSDDTLCWKITDNARHEAYKYLSMQRFLEEYADFFLQRGQPEKLVPLPVLGEG